MLFQASSSLTRLPGRYLLTTRDQHLVTDSMKSRGGPGEAWSAGELLAGALVSCCNALVESAATEKNIALDNLRIQASCEPDENKMGHYAYVRLEIFIDGPTPAQAEELVTVFTTVCPIYGSLTRGAPVTVQLNGKPFHG
ncbi:MAG: OsmC family protein [Pigmentiphaga sp.]